MKTTITNKSLYDSTVVSVDVNNVRNVTDKSFYANVLIKLIDGHKREFDGEFGYADYENDFGFVFKP